MVVALLLMSLASAGIVVGLAGGLRHTLHFRGPIATEHAPGSHLAAVQLPDNRFGCCVTVVDDSGPDPSASKLRLWVNGVELGPPHTQTETIRHGGAGFRHWGKQVFFALPDGVQNNSATEVVVRYPYWVRIRLAAVPAATLILAFALVASLVVRGGTKSLLPLVSAGGYLLLTLCSVLSVGVLALQLGFGHVDRTVGGPFQAEAGTPLKAVELRPLGALDCCLTVTSDSNENATGSDLSFWVNGEQILPAHMPHSEIRSGHKGFSHWGNKVYFALPEGTSNSSQTRVRTSYSLKPKEWTLLILPITLALFVGLYRQRNMAWTKDRSPSAAFAIQSPYLVLAAIGWTVLAAGAAYLATVLWGLFTGEALAPAIPFRSGLGRSLAETLDSALPRGLLILAAFGVASGWLAARSPFKNDLREAELAGIPWMRRYGLFCMAMVYLALVGATWAGARSGSSLTILGLAPYSDAGSYFRGMHEFLRDGAWGEVSSRRPVAAALRTALFGVSDFRLGVVLIWQAAAMAGSTFFAVMTLIRWRGLWAGVVFAALAYITARYHLAATMTEPLALPIAFVAIGFLAEAFRTSSKGPAFLALGLLSTAIWVRQGPTLVIPALALWFGWSFYGALPQKLKGFAIAGAAILAIIVVDRLLGVFFGSHSAGDLADSICGLSLGGDWSACLTAYPQEYAKVAASHDAQAAWLYAKAMHNIRHDPGTLVRTILHASISFWTDSPTILVQGYAGGSIPRSFPLALWSLAGLVFGGLGLRKRNARVEAPFWILIFAGLTASAMVVYLSDGPRVMAVAYPLLGLFVAAAFSSPIAPRLRCPRTVRQEVRLGAILTVAATVGLFVLMPLARLIYPLPRLNPPPGDMGPNTVIVGDFARSGGVLVVADGQPLPHGVPSVHLSRFAEVIAATGAEANQGILSPQAPKLPFGFMTMPTLDRGGSVVLLTPPEMMTRQDVRAWRVTYEEWNVTGKLFANEWRHVVSATPYLKPASK